MGPFIAGGINAGLTLGPSVPQAPQTCVNVTGQPAVNLADFYGQTGANYVTGTAAKYFSFFYGSGNSPGYVWVQTGGETDPAPGGTGIKADVSAFGSSATAAQLAAAVVTGIQGSGIASSFTMSAIVTSDTGRPQKSLVDFSGQTSASYITGGAGLYFNIWGDPGNEQAYFWFYVSTETDPYGGGSGYQVNISSSFTSSDLATALAAEINGHTSFWSATVVTGSDSQQSAVQITSLYNLPLTDTVDVNTGAAISTTQSGESPATTAAQFTATGSYNLSPFTAGASGASVSQTQTGYPSGHYCTPASWALEGLFNVCYFAASYGAVSPNAGGIGPGFTSQNLSGVDLLYQTIGSPIPSGTPANAQSQSIAALYDPTTTIGQAGAVQSNPTFQPTADWIQDAATGLYKPSMSFNGVNQYLATPGNIGITGAQPRTVFVVFKSNSTGNFTVFSLGSGSSGDGLFALIGFNGFFQLWTSGGIVQGNALDENWHVVGITFDGTNVNCLIDGDQMSGFPASLSVNTIDAPLFFGVDENKLFILNGNGIFIGLADYVFSPTQLSLTNTELAKLIPAS